jgi:hypothetical protein
MFRSQLCAIFLGCFVLAAPSAAQAKPPGPSILSEVTLTEGEKASFFTEVIIPLGGNQHTHYGVYVQGYGDIGGSTPAGHAGGYVNFSKVPIQNCSSTFFFGGINEKSKALVRARLFCKI